MTESGSRATLGAWGEGDNHLRGGGPSEIQNGDCTSDEKWGFAFDLIDKEFLK